MHVRTTAGLIALTASAVCAQERAAPDTTGYVRIVGDTVTIIRPAGAAPFPTKGLPDYVLPVAMADTLSFVLQGDSAVTLRPIPGVPVSKANVRRILGLARAEQEQAARKP